MESLKVRSMFGKQIGHEIAELEADYGLPFTDELRRNLALELEKKFYFAWLGEIQRRIAQIKRLASHDVVGQASQIAQLLNQIADEHSDIFELQLVQMLSALEHSNSKKELSLAEKNALGDLYRVCQSIHSYHQNQQWFIWLETFDL